MSKDKEIEVQEETNLKDGQFEVDGVIYELRFNYQKIKTIELVTKMNVFSEIVNTNGMLPLSLLEQLFSFGLVESKTLESVPQKKALSMFEPFLEENGMAQILNLITDKLQSDVGFMFR